MRHDNANLQGTPNLHKTITDIKSNPWNGVFVIADGIPHIIRGGNLVAYAEGTGTNYSGPLGALNMHEIPLPFAESGSVADYGPYGSSAYLLFTNGNLYTVGENAYGQLGVGDTVERTIYTLSNTGVTKVFTSPSNANRAQGYPKLIIQKTDGKVYGCGYNSFGQLGLGNTTQNITTWTELTWCGTNPLSVWNMGAYVGCTFCQRADGTIWAAGYNASGQLGNGNQTSVISTAVNVTTNWTGGATGMIIQQVVGGLGQLDQGANENGNITMFMDNGTTSRIASAGGNEWGTLGDGTTTTRSTPVAPSGFSGRVQQIGRTGDYPGSIHVLKTDGTYWNWGYNSHGQLGTGNTTQQNTPGQRLTGVVRMLNEVYTTYAYGYAVPSPIIESGSAYFRSGYNIYGNIGIGTITDTGSFQRMRFPVGTVLSKVGAHSTLHNNVSYYAVDTNQNFYTWGSNIYNGCFDSQTTVLAIPTRVAPSALIR